MRKCSKCFRETIKIKRGYCNSCYEFLRRNKKIKVTKSLQIKELSDEQEQVLIGSLLGDGCLILDKNAINSRLAILRKLDDVEYLKWEIKIFNNLCIDDPLKYKNIFDKRTNKTYYQCFFRTRNCSALNYFYNKWYVNGKKIIPNDIELTPLVLLVWFLDDGNISIIKNNRLKFSLATNCFSKKDSEYLANMLSKLTGYYFGVHKSGKSFLIQGTDGAARSFIKLIEPVYLECMLRKAVWKNPKVRFNDPTLKIYKSQGKRSK